VGPLSRRLQHFAEYTADIDRRGVEAAVTDYSPASSTRPTSFGYLELFGAPAQARADAARELTGTL